MSLLNFEKIPDNYISKNGVQALATRPNKISQYGHSGLSAEELKKWFDNLAIEIISKLNNVSDVLASDDATKYIKSPFRSYGVESLDDLCASITDGTFASNLLAVEIDGEKQFLLPILIEIKKDLDEKISDKDITVTETGHIKVPDEPYRYNYVDGAPEIDPETGKPKKLLDRTVAINANYLFSRKYANNLSASFKDGTLSLVLKHERETISSFQLKITNPDTENRLTALEEAINGAEEKLRMLNEGGIE